MNSATLAAVTPTTPITPLTPDSCYRSGEDTVSIDDAQEVFASEKDAENIASNSCSGLNSDDVVNNSKHSTLVEVKVKIPVTKFCDIPESDPKKDCNQMCPETTSKNNTSSDACDAQIVKTIDEANSDQANSDDNRVRCNAIRS